MPAVDSLAYSGTRLALHRIDHSCPKGSLRFLSILKPTCITKRGILNMFIRSLAISCSFVLFAFMGPNSAHSEDNSGNSLTRQSQWSSAIGASKEGNAVVRDSSGRMHGTITHSGNRLTFRDDSGRLTGTATISGSTTIFRDSSGRSAGTATTHQGKTTFRSSSGSSLGSASQSSSKTTFRDASGRSLGSANGNGSRTTFRDGSGRLTGSAGR